MDISPSIIGMHLNFAGPPLRGLLFSRMPSPNAHAENKTWLLGKRIILTLPHPLLSQRNANKQPPPLWITTALQEQGAQVMHIPLLTIQAQINPLSQEGDFDWLFFTSKNGVHAFFQDDNNRMRFAQTNIAVIGPMTAQALNDYHLQARFIAPSFQAQKAAPAFLDMLGQSHPPLHILCPCGNLANDTLANVLKQAGHHAVQTVVYTTQARQDLSTEEQTRLSQNADLIVFTSPSAVEAYQQLRAAHQYPLPKAIACIGPTTGQSAIAAFGKVPIQPTQHTLVGLFDEILAFFKPVTQ